MEYLGRYAENPATPSAATLGPCWDWQGATGSQGYGVIRTPLGIQGAHVVFYERCEGPIPPGLELDHLCRRPICVRPTHLEPVTRAVNTQRGDIATLSPADVAAIRDEHRNTDPTAWTRARVALAGRLRVSTDTVQRIVEGKTWRNVE